MLIKWEKNTDLAPAIIEEKAFKFFGVSKNYKCSTWKSCKSEKEFTNKLSAVTHLDNSGRLQTVDKNENRDFYNILIEFEKLTGFPILSLLLI